MMQQVNIQYHKCEIGELIIGSFEHTLCLLDYRYRNKKKAIDNRIKIGLNANYTERSDDIIAMAIQQVEEYLVGKREKFDIPFLMVGSEFQKEIVIIGKKKSVIE